MMILSGWSEMGCQAEIIASLDKNAICGRGQYSSLGAGHVHDELWSDTDTDPHAHTCTDINPNSHAGTNRNFYSNSHAYADSNPDPYTRF
jgi:hypothetical protein